MMHNYSSLIPPPGSRIVTLLYFPQKLKVDVDRILRKENCVYQMHFNMHE